MPPQLQQKIKELRLVHPGWGPNNLLAELKEDPYWSTTSLPFRARVAAFLKNAGLTRSYQPHRPLPPIPSHPPHQPHKEWQLDAQGAMRVEGVGSVGIINLVDVTSRLKVESYPSLGSHNPGLADYHLTLRRTFLNFGLPKRITLIMVPFSMTTLLPRLSLQNTFMIISFRSRSWFYQGTPTHRSRGSRADASNNERPGS